LEQLSSRSDFVDEEMRDGKALMCVASQNYTVKMLSLFCSDDYSHVRLGKAQ
jgi:hypothetical protein